MRVSLVITVPRVLTWSCVILLAVLSLLPGQALAALSLLPAMKLVRTIIPAPLEHFVAYAGVAAIAVVAYSPSRVGVRIIGGLCVYAGILEYIRHFSPGRHPSLGKFAGSALGALCGGLAVALCYGVARPISRAEFFKIVPRALRLSVLPASSHGSHPCRSRNRGSSKTSTLTSS